MIFNLYVYIGPETSVMNLQCIRPLYVTTLRMAECLAETCRSFYITIFNIQGIHKRMVRFQ
jgi:hypothetical protein